MIQITSQYFNIINEDSFLKFCNKQNLQVDYLSYKLAKFSGEPKYLYDKIEFNTELVKFIDFETNKINSIIYTEIDKESNYKYAITLYKDGSCKIKRYILNDSSI